MCLHPGSNWGPSDLQSDALPTELSRLGFILFLHVSVEGDILCASFADVLHHAEYFFVHHSVLVSVHRWLDIAVHKNWESHIDASHSRQPLVKGERLVRYEVNAVILRVLLPLEKINVSQVVLLFLSSFVDYHVSDAAQGCFSTQCL